MATFLGSTSSTDTPVATRSYRCVTVDIGAAEWKIAHSISVSYILSEREVPCLKFTTIAEVQDEKDWTYWPCVPQELTSQGRPTTSLCIPLRGALDLLHLLLTGNKDIARTAGYDSVFPYDGEVTDDGFRYNLVALASVLGRMNVPSELNFNSVALGDIGEPVTGFWGIYRCPTGLVFITSDTWTDWESADDKIITPPAICPADPGSDAEGDRDDEMLTPPFEHSEESGYGTGSDRDDDEAMSSSVHSDDSGYEDDVVFPLCHSEQLPSLVAILHQWLDAAVAQCLVVNCRTPDRVTLVPVRERNNDPECSHQTQMTRWPQLTKDEKQAMTTITYVYE